MTLRINPTRLRRFFRCEREWYAYAVELVEPRSRVSGPGQARGKTMHALIEHALREYARTGNVFDFAGDDGYAAAEHVYEHLWHTEGTSLDEQAAHELLAAIRYHVPRLNLPAWEVLTIDDKPAIELHLVAPFPGVDGIELESVVDVVFRHRATGKIWLIDWKTTFNAIDSSDLRPHLANDYQLSIERWLLELHGIKVDMSAKVHLRSRAPQLPDLTTRRKVTRDKSKLTCDWDTYRAAIVANGENPDAEDVQLVREHLATSVFQRWRQDITPPAIDERLRDQVTEAARRMVALAERKHAPLMNLRDHETKLHRGCGACDYDKWCTAALSTPTGASDLSLLAVDYRCRPESPYADEQVSARPPYDPSAAYVRFAAERGQELQPHQEFRP